jgi:SET domain-containing protein
MNTAVRVARSFTGSGVFAKSDFKRGMTIGEVTGKYKLGFDGEYAIEIDDEYSLDPATPFRFLNHSCHPNAQLITDIRKNGRHLRMFVGALRRIRAGDEITIAYGWDAVDAVPCRCGNKKCLGWVVDPEQLSLITPDGRRPKIAVST